MSITKDVESIKKLLIVFPHFQVSLVAGLGGKRFFLDPSKLQMCQGGDFTKNDGTGGLCINVPVRSILSKSKIDTWYLILLKLIIGSGRLCSGFYIFGFEYA